MIGTSVSLTVANDRELDHEPGAAGDVLGQLGRSLEALAIGGDDDVSLLQLPLGGASVLDADDGERAVADRDRQAQRPCEQHCGQHEVHHHAGEQDGDPDPDRPPVEGAGHGVLDLGTGEALLAQPSNLDVAILAEHLHEPAEWDPVQAVARPVPGDRGDSWGKTDPELLDRDAGPLGDDEVAELVDEHQDDEDAEEGGDGAEDLHQAPRPVRGCRAARIGPRRRGRRWPRVRARRRSPHRPTASAMVVAIWPKPMRPARNASTATSSAAFRMVPRFPPASAAARTVSYAG